MRYLRTEPTMAFPEGRLLALHDTRLHVLAADGWTQVGTPNSADPPRGAQWLTREEAEDWCDREGWDLHLLDHVG